MHRNEGGTGGVQAKLIFDQSILIDWQIEEFLRFVSDNMENKIKVRTLNMSIKERELEQV
jgi:hypothetical protein